MLRHTRGLPWVALRQEPELCDDWDTRIECSGFLSILAVLVSTVALCPVEGRSKQEKSSKAPMTAPTQPQLHRPK